MDTLMAFNVLFLCKKRFFASVKLFTNSENFFEAHQLRFGPKMDTESRTVITEEGILEGLSKHFLDQ
jgi:hypothetical protein